ncbi:hypothetical protein SAMN02927900_06551 [Rhizobium mongolense subsp. loessense]|uniref:Transposase n=1 Tax=Rhizobium mongolense subsp. loessense TaxID=158890 RepID=A0A1G4UC49_9HYPH|nr:hypothetical protein SAMN02927900_06551 [Rhizobium mongolense subsp. loessense]
MFYAALDVSLRSVAISIIDQDGKVRLERSVPSDVAACFKPSRKPACLWQAAITRRFSWAESGIDSKFCTNLGTANLLTAFLDGRV